MTECNQLTPLPFKALSRTSYVVILRAAQYVFNSSLLQHCGL